MQQVLINGQWQDADSTGSFQADNPATKEALADRFPFSSWNDCDAALDAASSAFEALQELPSSKIADFLRRYADLIEENKQALCELANAETALPVSPRLLDGELPRTTGQLRQAADAAEDGSWKSAVIDTATDIRSCFRAIGPVCVFGPNNFPFAFGSASGGDFAAAIAAGNPVIAKANSSHPATTREFAKLAQQAVNETGLPAATVQLIYRTTHLDGALMVSDPRVGAIGYTGSRKAGLLLKKSAEKVGNPIYLELSSVNPVIILPGALKERGEEIAADFSGSCLMGTGQFCTNPGMVILIKDESTEGFVSSLTTKFKEAPVGTLLSRTTESGLGASILTLIDAGAKQLAGGSPGDGTGYSHGNTLLQVSGTHYLTDAEVFQTEAFGNCSLLVIADDQHQAWAILHSLEGNLTGCIYSDTQGSDDVAYDALAPALRQKVGRLLNDKMPTGVAVSAAMNHGGPFPATGHPGFTAVGIPASIGRFAMLQCYDAVRPHRLPVELQDKTPNATIWRSVDGAWKQGDVS
ncbi:MAG: aldehyde dehydrogenase (NADP(+)) [Pirellulales bacterium]